MKKGIFLVLLGMLLVTGCQHNSNLDKDSIAVNTENLNGEKDNLTMATSRYGLINSPYAVTDTGCYEIYTHEDATANILYTDFETAQRIFLSNSLNNSYNQQGDTSFIENMEGGIAAFSVEPYVYLMHFGVDSYCSKGNASVPGHLYRLGKDGQNRKTLVTFDGSYIAPDGTIVYGNGKLYALTEDRNNGQKKCLISIDCETGEINKLKEMDYNSWFIVVHLVIKLF